MYAASLVAQPSEEFIIVAGGLTLMVSKIKMLFWIFAQRLKRDSLKWKYVAISRKEQNLPALVGLIREEGVIREADLRSVNIV